ncbi:hypothetical protein GH5_03513 [Leishmania sp. Ghana 2012 LV757]|uniref:hypothetical protein n=1 Tax=Leishmania sp. Ghana 2012 LV757 TaxID=2803181 RepID=UPI001B416350|nr:hypothetical protein GH5_03513 [Leishmania sp. Ghana 2012 LV757]
MCACAQRSDISSPPLSLPLLSASTPQPSSRRAAFGFTGCDCASRLSVSATSPSLSLPTASSSVFFAAPFLPPSRFCTYSSTCSPARTLPSSLLAPALSLLIPYSFSIAPSLLRNFSNHHTSSMEFIQCSYLGQHTPDGRRFHGLGRYTFPNGDVYLGGMQDGQFHGNGVVFFRDRLCGSDGGGGGSPARASPASPRPPPPSSGDEAEDHTLHALLSPDTPSVVSTATMGGSPVAARDFAAPAGPCGQYRGVWEHGRHVSGYYVFEDGLVYGSDAKTDTSDDLQKGCRASWTYCHGSDRRLWEEYLQNVAPVLPHEALLGGARLLHARKEASAKKDEHDSEAPATNADGTGEGLPMVLPRAFVHARTAPAFAKGQLTGIDDPRVTRWAESAAAAEERQGALRLQPRQQQVASPPSLPGCHPTIAGSSGDVDAEWGAPPELIESTVVLQFAMAVPTEGLRADGRLDDEEADMVVATDEVAEEGAVAAAALVTTPAAPQPALNLAVCRVVDVEDVNRTLVQIVAAP